MFEDLKPEPGEATFGIYNTWTFKDTEASLAIRLNILPEVLEILQPRDWQASSPVETAFQTGAKLEYLYGETSSAGYEMHEYLEELLTADFAKFQEEMKFSSVTPFIIRFRKLTSAVAQTDLKLPDKAYIILIINAFRSSYEMWAERWLKLARSCNSIVG